MRGALTRPLIRVPLKGVVSHNIVTYFRPLSFGMLRQLVVRGSRYVTARPARPRAAARHIVAGRYCPAHASRQGIFAVPRRHVAGVIEADFVEKGEGAPATSTSDSDAGLASTVEDELRDGGGEDKDGVDIAPSLPEPGDWCGDVPSSAAYGCIISAVRLTAELAYAANGAAVGALAEASGDEDAAIRWLDGGLALLEGSPGALPDWYGEDREKHRAAVRKLAGRRHGKHFVKRCLDVKQLKSDLGWESYRKLEEVASALYANVRGARKKEEGKEKLDFGIDGNFQELMGREEEDLGAEGKDPFYPSIPKEAIDEALEIWGDEAQQELFQVGSKQYAEEVSQMKEMGQDLIARMERS